MQLSNRASKYLEKLNRDLNFTCSPELTVKYLQNSGLTAFESVIRYQTNFSGLSLTVGENPNKSFNASLFSINDLRAGAPIDIVLINHKYYFFCGDFVTAQFYIVLCENGEICTYDEKEETVNPIYSTAELLLENYAVLDYMSQNAVELPSYFELKNSELLKQAVSGFGHFYKANDKYNQWYVSEKVVVCTGVWFDRPENYVHLYGKSIEEAGDFEDLLRSRNII